MRLYFALLLAVVVTIGYPLYNLATHMEARVGQLNATVHVDHKRD